MLEKVTIVCGYCGCDFTTTYDHKDHGFCSDTCRSAGLKHKNKRTSSCLMCGVDFCHHGERRFCSHICSELNMSQHQLGLRSDSGVVACKTCGNLNQSSFCSRICWLKNKKLIQARCILCGESNEPKSTHYIDYDDNNVVDSNLVLLCNQCYNLTRRDRAFWEVFFTAGLSGCKLVKKIWGAEVHIANNENYCLKYLVFFAGSNFSHHYHKVKKETWHCLLGGFDLLLTHLDNKEEVIPFVKGQIIEILPGVVHQLKAKHNSVIVEVSTQSFDEDSFKDKNIIPDE